MSSENPQTPKYIDLSSLAIPQRVKINSQELGFEQLSDKQKNILVDLARIDKEIADTEFSLRVLKAAKNELNKLLNSEFSS